MKFDFQVVPSKKAASTLALSKPDIGPQSRPAERAAMMKYAPCRLLLRNAVDSINKWFCGELRYWSRNWQAHPNQATRAPCWIIRWWFGPTNSAKGIITRWITFRLRRSAAVSTSKWDV